MIWSPISIPEWVVLATNQQDADALPSPTETPNMWINTP